MFEKNIWGDTEPVIFPASGTTHINTGKAVMGCSSCLLPDEVFEVENMRNGKHDCVFNNPYRLQYQVYP